MPVTYAIILATPEVAVRRITVGNLPQANSSLDPILKIPNIMQGW
jgi:hypothetical protein